MNDKTMPTEEVRRELRTVLDHVQGGGSVTVTRSGKAVARIVPVVSPPVTSDTTKFMDRMGAIAEAYRTPGTNDGTLPAYIGNIVRESVQRATAVGHKTVWANGDDVLRIDGVPHSIFVFVTYSPDRVKAVEALLREHGHLCKTDLGVMTPEDRAKPFVAHPKLGDRWGGLTPEQWAMVPVGSKVDFKDEADGGLLKVSPDGWDHTDGRTICVSDDWINDDRIITHLPEPK